MARILVVEDDPMNCKIFHLILSRIGGHEVTVASDSEEAIEFAKNESVDLVIMDISLQNWIYKGREVNGIDLTKIIKVSEKSKDIPILLATAHAMKYDRENLLGMSGADDYFAKPIENHADFLKKVEILLERKYTAEKGV